jgi:hypothetical protein
MKSNDLIDFMKSATRQIAEMIEKHKSIEWMM